MSESAPPEARSRHGELTTSAGLRPSSATESQLAPTIRGFVYAVGRLSPHFPSIAAEKEYLLLAGTNDGAVRTDQLGSVLTKPENRYLARHICWVFVADGIEAFLVMPRDDAECVRLLEAVQSRDSDELVHVVVGQFYEATVDQSDCTASGLAYVRAEHVLAFTMRQFSSALTDITLEIDSERAQPVDVQQSDDSDLIHQAFNRLTMRADNRGVRDEHRALNFLALRYPPLYELVLKQHGSGAALQGIDARATFSGNRRVVRVGLAFRKDSTGSTVRFRCLVDVAEVFPFLVAGFRPADD